MKTCYLCGKQKPDCLLNPPACFECRTREDLPLLATALVPKGREAAGQGTIWVGGHFPVPQLKWNAGVVSWDGTWINLPVTLDANADSEANFVEDAKQAGWSGPRRRVTFPIGEDGKPTGPGIEMAYHAPGCKFSHLGAMLDGRPCGYCREKTAALDLQVAAEGLRSSIKRVTCGQHSEARATHFCTLEPGHGGPHRMEQCEPAWQSSSEFVSRYTEGLFAGTPEEPKWRCIDGPPDTADLLNLGWREWEAVHAADNSGWWVFLDNRTWKWTPTPSPK